MSQLSIRTCRSCVEFHGTIVSLDVVENRYGVEAHPNCKCVYVPMRTKTAGSATDKGIDGADMHLMIHRQLPNYYVTKKIARKNGWVDWKGNLFAVMPGSIIGGDIYKNRNGKLPSSAQRVWYEADINYTGGYRNDERILYSNDGLIFVSYDHYHTFHEITP